MRRSRGRAGARFAEGSDDPAARRPTEVFQPPVRPDSAGLRALQIATLDYALEVQRVVLEISEALAIVCPGHLQKGRTPVGDNEPATVSFIGMHLPELSDIGLHDSKPHTF